MSWRDKQSQGQKMQWRKVNLVNPLVGPYTFEQRMFMAGLTSATAPTHRLVQYLNGQTMVHGAIQDAQSSIIQSPEAQDVQIYTLVENKQSQELADNGTDLQNCRETLTQSPLYTEILNNLLSDMPAVPHIKEENVQEDSSVVAATPTIDVTVPTQVYEDSSSQCIAKTQEEALRSNSTNWVQVIKTQTMTNVEAAAQPRGMIQDAKTSNPHRNHQVVVQPASGEIQAYQSQASPAKTIAPEKVPASALPTHGATERVTRKRKIHVKNSERSQADTLFERAKKSKKNYPDVDPRTPPVKLARMKQNTAKGQAQDRSKKKSPMSKDQDKSWHSSGSLLPLFCVVEHSQNQLEGDRRKVHAEFVLVKKDLLFNQLIEMAMLALGYSQSSATQAKGLIQVGSWNPVPLSCVTNDPGATVADMLQDIHHVITLKIQLQTCPKLEDIPPEQWTHLTVRSALRDLLTDMSQSSLAQKCPLSQSMISSLKNCAYYSNVSAGKCHEFGRWYRLFMKTKCNKEIESFPEHSAHVTLNQQLITDRFPEQRSTILFSQREATMCAPSTSGLYPPGLVTQPLSSQMDNPQPVTSQVLNQQYAVRCRLASHGLSPSPQQYVNYSTMIAPANVFSKAPDFQAPQQGQCRQGGAQKQTTAVLSEGHYDVPSDNNQCVKDEPKSADISQAISSLVAFNSSQNVLSEMHMEEDQKHSDRQTKHTLLQLSETERENIYQEAQRRSLIGFSPSCSNIPSRSTKASLSVEALRGLWTNRSDFSISTSIYEEIQNEIKRANVSYAVFAKVSVGKSKGWLCKMLHCKDDPNPGNQNLWVDLCMIHFFLRLSQTRRDYIYELERI